MTEIVIASAARTPVGSFTAPSPRCRPRARHVAIQAALSAPA